MTDSDRRREAYRQIVTEVNALLDALDDLSAGGSTNGAAGIQLAYRLATESFIEGGINRVILATDGDFNVGTTDEGSLIRLIEAERDRALALLDAAGRRYPRMALALGDRVTLRWLHRSDNPYRDEIARLARENAYAVVGSSANRSLTGSKFVFSDIEDQVLEAADITVDYGEVPYPTPGGLGSTIVDLISWETIRVGAVYDQICDIVLERFDIDLKGVMAAKA